MFNRLKSSRYVYFMSSAYQLILGLMLWTSICQLPVASLKQRQADCRWIAAVRDKLLTSVFTEVLLPHTNAAQLEYEVERKAHWCLKEQFSSERKKQRFKRDAQWEADDSPETENTFTSETKRGTQHVKLWCLTHRCEVGAHLNSHWKRLHWMFKLEEPALDLSDILSFEPWCPIFLSVTSPGFVC